MSPTSTSIAEARTIFGSFMLGPDDVARVLGDEPAHGDLVGAVPFARAELEHARSRGDVLIFRTASDGRAPLTLARLIERFPETLQSGLHKGVGYQLKDEWTVLQEPFAATATCRPGWRLVHGSPVPSTCNRNYEEQNDALRRYNAEGNGSGTYARRSAVEAAYDIVLLNRAHGTRLLERSFDWSETPTQDGGFVTVGQFEADGLRIVGYSRAVRFGSLGICPQR